MKWLARILVAILYLYIFGILIAAILERFLL